VGATVLRPVHGGRVAAGLSSIGATAACYALIIAAWWLGSLALPPIVLPGPLPVAAAIADLVRGERFFADVGLTLMRTVLGVAASAIGALVIIFAARYVGWFRRFYQDALYPLSRALPTVSVGLFGLAWFGLGSPAVAFVVFITVLPIYLTNLWEAQKVADASVLEMARAISRARFRVVWKVLLPLLVPTLFSATKFAFSVGFKLSLVGEILAASDGMGYSLLHSMQEYKTTEVLAWIVVLIAMVVMLDWAVFDRMERAILRRWAFDD
jgi:NitT/TauT family transport system permease protein